MARGRRAQQLEIRGAEREKVPELQEAAEDYRALRDEAIEVNEKAKKAKAILIERMKSHGRTVFGYLDEDGNERKVEMSTRDNAKVRKIGKAGDDAPGDSGTPPGDSIEVS
jgi:hypothetical protein